MINVHPDILYGLLPKFKEAGVKAIIGGSESPKEMPLGQRRQVEEKAAELGMEAAFAKPFCALAPDPNKPIIAQFLKEARIGNPVIEFSVQGSREGKDVIMGANVVRSAPCGSTWFVAKKMLGLETDQPDLREISEAQYSYPCRLYGEGCRTWRHCAARGRLYHTRCSGGGAEEGKQAA